MTVDITKIRDFDSRKKVPDQWPSLILDLFLVFGMRHEEYTYHAMRWCFDHIDFDLYYTRYKLFAKSRSTDKAWNLLEDKCIETKSVYGKLHKPNMHLEGKVRSQFDEIYRVVESMCEDRRISTQSSFLTVRGKRARVMFEDIEIIFINN